MGVGRDGLPKAGFTLGMEFFGKYILLAEGREVRCRGGRSLVMVSIPQAGRRSTESVSKNCGKSPTVCFLPVSFSILSVGRCPKARAAASFLNHYGDRLVSVGFVVHLNNENPTLSPFGEFQRFKTHPFVRDTFVAGKRIGYGARMIVSGGWQSAPKLVFPGGALIGMLGGLVNFAALGGSHNAILSRILPPRRRVRP
jgi:electron-transferring-flavoprotein dehydrogenase